MEKDVEELSREELLEIVRDREAGEPSRSLRVVGDGGEDGGGKAPSGSMVKVTSHGVTITVDVRRFDDYELFEEIAEDPTGMSAMVRLMRLTCGDDYDRVKEALRDDEGRVGIETVSDFVNAVFAQVKALKNS